jgi:hypothetical protein
MPLRARCGGDWGRASRLRSDVARCARSLRGRLRVGSCGRTVARAQHFLRPGGRRSPSGAPGSWRDWAKVRRGLDEAPGRRQPAWWDAQPMPEEWPGKRARSGHRRFRIVRREELGTLELEALGSPQRPIADARPGALSVEPVDGKPLNLVDARCGSRRIRGLGRPEDRRARTRRRRAARHFRRALPGRSALVEARRRAEKTRNADPRKFRSPSGSSLAVGSR